jgi:hypothetical protein
MHSNQTREIERGTHEAPMGVRLLQDWQSNQEVRHTRWFSRPSVTRIDGVWN